MGLAIAAEAAARGADVRLVLGPGTMAPPAEVSVHRVTTAEQMRDAVVELVEGADVVVMAAAVADFRPKQAAAGKLKKDEGPPDLVLEPTPVVFGFLLSYASIRGGLPKFMRSSLMTFSGVASIAGSAFGVRFYRFIEPDGYVNRLVQGVGD